MRRGTLVFVLGLAVLLPAAAEARTVRVDCSKGQSLNGALASSADPLVVEFSGTCAEDVLIARSGVELRGTGVAPAIVGAPGVPAADRKAGVTLDGAHNIVLRNFSVTDSDSRGIAVLGSKAVTLDGIVSTGNASHGLLLFGGAGVVVRNSSFDSNAGDGIGAWENSSVSFDGTVSMTANTRAGLIVSGSSSASVVPTGATVSANGNQLGFLLQIGGQVQMSALAPTSCAASGNAELGIGISSSSTWAGRVSVDGSPMGVSVDASSSLSVNQLSVTGGEIAVWVNSESYAYLGNPTLTGSDTSLWVDDAAVEVSSASLHGAVYEDVHLEFGAKLSSWGGSSAGVVSCDGTVLTRGAISCPAPVAAGVRRSIRSDAVAGTARPEPRAVLTVD